MPTDSPSHRRERLCQKRKCVVTLGISDLAVTCLIALFTPYFISTPVVKEPNTFDEAIMKHASDAYRMALQYKVVWAIGIINIALFQQRETWVRNIRIFTLVTRVIIGIPLLAVTIPALSYTESTLENDLLIYALTFALELICPILMNAIYTM